MIHLIKKIQQYMKAHLSTSFAVILAVLVLLFFIGFQTYLRYGYLKYMEQTAEESENAVLSALTKTVNATMADNINFGSELAVSNVLYQAASKTDKANASDLTLYNLLTGYEYPQNVVSAAVIGSEGLIGQYDRFRSTYYGSMWNSSNLADAEKLREDVIAQCNKYGENVFPRYVMTTEPGLHSVHTNNLRVFHIGYPILGGGSGISDVKYVLVLTFNMELFSEFLNSVETPKIQYAEGYIADSGGTILYQRETQNIGQNTESLKENPYIRICNEDLDYFNWTLNIRIDEKVLREHIDRIYRNAFWILLFILASYAVLVSFMMNHALRPVKKVSRAIRTVKEGNHRTKIPIEGSHEIWQLAEEYNRMTDDLTEKEQEIEKSHETAMASLKGKYQAEREALESQINAHFICNTLGVINYEAIDAGDDRVSILLKKLSNILRYTFDQKCQEVLFRQEIAWIDQYLFLQKERFEDLFDYKIDFEEEYGDWPCCKLMLQPFVENSIIHGFERRHSGGFLQISAAENEGDLRVVISDNGCGMEKETSEVIQGILKKKGEIDPADKLRTGIGIRNVITRMYMFYGDRLEVSMTTAPGEGTKFIFRIPLPPAESESCENED